MQWKGINRKQSTRWQHLSRLKASASFSLQNFLVDMKHSNLYLGLVLPSGGWQSLILSNLFQYNSMHSLSVQCKAFNFFSVQCDAVQFISVWFNALYVSAMQCSTLYFNTTVSSAMQCSTLYFNTTVSSAMQCNPVQAHAIFDNIVPDAILSNLMQIISHL